MLKYGIDLSRERDEHKHWAWFFWGDAVLALSVQFLSLTLGERAFFIGLACLLVGVGIYETLAWYQYAQEYKRNRPN